MSANDYSARHAIEDDVEAITRMADAAVNAVASPHTPRHSAEQVQS